MSPYDHLLSLVLARGKSAAYNKSLVAIADTVGRCESVACALLVNYFISAHCASYVIRNLFHRKLSVDGTSFAESHEFLGDERRAAIALECDFVLVGIPATIEVAIVAQPPRRKKRRSMEVQLTKLRNLNPISGR